MAYRTTPHKVTGSCPAELLFNRRIRTKLPGLRFQQEGEVDREVKPGDQIMKTTTKTPWVPRPYTLTKVKGLQVEVRKGGGRRLKEGH